MNELKNEKSPYLLQHAENPVHWAAWSEKTLAQARQKDLPIFISIGYSTCHWCHVMEHESFENRQIADYLNTHFTCIKIDREEHPDIDSIYMNAVQMMNGRGGWPLNVFLDTSLKPFFGGTYFRPPVFLNLLTKIHEAWTTDRAALTAQGEHLYQHLLAMSQDRGSENLRELPLHKYLSNFESIYDHVHGGKLGAPKFPLSYDLILLSKLNSPNAKAMLRHTVTQMGRSGTYDQLEGGLHRYSTDDQWKIPHFEKMLYDQSAFIEACLSDYRTNHEEEALFIATRTIDYVLNRLQTPMGAFYSAEDADSEGIEGKFYRWGKNEIHQVLDKKSSDELLNTLDWPEAGNFEGHFVLHLTTDLAIQKWYAQHQQALSTLQSYRSKRVRPIIDTKVLTGWNGLFLSALARYIQTSGTTNDAYQDALLKAVDFIKTHLYQSSNGELYRRWADGESKYRGSEADYSFLIAGLISAFGVLPSPELADWIESLLKKHEELFSDAQTGLYWSTPIDEPNILIREMDLYDNVEPAGTSLAFKNLSNWYAISGNEFYWQRLQKMRAGLPKSISDRPHGFAALLSALLDEQEGIATYFIVSSDKEFIRKTAKEILSQNSTETIVIQVDPENQNIDSIPWIKEKRQSTNSHAIYRCKNQTCELIKNL